MRCQLVSELALRPKRKGSKRCYFLLVLRNLYIFDARNVLRNGLCQAPPRVHLTNRHNTVACSHNYEATMSASPGTGLQQHVGHRSDVRPPASGGAPTPVASASGTASTPAQTTSRAQTADAHPGAQQHSHGTQRTQPASSGNVEDGYDVRRPHLNPTMVWTAWPAKPFWGEGATPSPARVGPLASMDVPCGGVAVSGRDQRRCGCAGDTVRAQRR